jgi:hypothetical protein
MVQRYKKRPRIDEERMMEKLGIRRLDATSSHLVTKDIMSKKCKMNLLQKKKPDIIICECVR